ncbi:MAG: hypothetical protein ACLU0O_03415 [Collinsella sp.]
MDEFIRNNKKVVIAADRAPKDLNMDAPDQSALMPATVSVAGQLRDEYKILSVITGTIAAAPEAGNDSLLAAYGGDGGI